MGIASVRHRSATHPAMSHTSTTTRSAGRSVSASWNARGVDGTGRNSWVWSSGRYQQNRLLALPRSIARMTIAGLRALSVPRDERAGRTPSAPPSLSQVQQTAPELVNSPREARGT